MSYWPEPVKRIFDSSDLKNFEKSIAFHELKETLDEIVVLVQGVKLPPGILDVAIVTRDGNSTGQPRLPPPSVVIPTLDKRYSDNVEQLLHFFVALNKDIDETPPISGPARFGNVAFRKWYEKMEKRLPQLLLNLTSTSTSTDTGTSTNTDTNTSTDTDTDTGTSTNSVNNQQFVEEASHYLDNSFGSKMRLDYGTGHELSFLAFLGGLMRYKFIENPTGEEILVLFAKYYDLVRSLISVYNLEPAGSHGVWGLDDHFHLIYILGASQFCNDPSAPSVKSALSKQLICAYMATNLYINAIAFIFKLKSGPFFEHSPIINDIHTNVVSWNKVRQGLMKMYMVEVFGKFPVIQHFWFGEKLYPWRDARSKNLLPFHQKEEEGVGGGGDSSNVHSQKLPMPMTAAPWATKQRNPPPSRK
ncbi:RRD1 [Candida oxycetoniae]|uniref:Serine/threonine-protein phosphatase 2A activator n=1 Tax=Candida oxycetoniae TaxID=497107 RepID=A0AAI9SWM1_9ASCO|nr:RRD1 [Candida oxycetoniae]KAI3404466.2 RRD1 [Candida oxycetoniae]